MWRRSPRDLRDQFCKLLESELDGTWCFAHLPRTVYLVCCGQNSIIDHSTFVNLGRKNPGDDHPPIPILEFMKMKRKTNVVVCVSEFP